jgi:hypothetical protein
MGLHSYRIRIQGWDYFSEIEVPFLSFDDYVSGVDEMIDKEILKAKEKYDEFLKMDERLKEFYSNPWDEITLRQKEGLQTIYYDSLIISIYSFVEKKMNYLCRYLQENKRIKLKDFSGEGIHKYRNYLEKVIELDFSKKEPVWDRLIKYGFLRNFLNHSENGRLITKDTNNRQVIIDFLKTCEGVKVIPNEQDYLFEFESNLILKNLIKISKELLEELFLEEHIVSDKDEKSIADWIFNID